MQMEWSKSAGAFCGVAALVLTGAAARATVVPFTEEFAANAANWFDGTGAAPLSWNATGGPDGGAFASGGFNFVSSVDGDTPVMFRAHDEFGSSGGAFVGDWIGDGVTELTALVRHDAPVPLTFFTRVSSPANFPGAVAINFAPVLPNTWSPITFAIDPASPQFISFEGSDFATIFGNIGHVQVGVSVPQSLAGADQQFNFDIDKVSITPEPATMALLLVGASLVRWRRGRR